MFLRSSFLWFLPCLFLAGCKKQSQGTIQKEALADSVGIPEIVPEKEFPSGHFTSWTEIDSIFPAYTVTQQSAGMVIELFQSNSYSYFDSIFEALVPEPVKGAAVDSSELFVLRSDKKLNEFFLKVPVNFYVTGLKKDYRTTIKDVAYYVDEDGCRSSLILFRFENYDLKKSGPPLFCTLSPIKVERCYCEDINDMVHAFEKEQAYDYTDSIQTKVFARKNSMAFAYADDFHWERRKCLFPSRQVFMVKNNSVYPFWSAGLDLFGIACD